ncbi:bifunctional 3-(3-hydroxy-phenyl)propionate/3-hydroxycinnamic acid hydroxylase [Roseibium litorale]|uniref:Bifunctional 3-(3-hydroxy-phenyl)propionate/3-hydroxycinnamic acid hydroxylase n=1 Tax=Roseibium litorale TaxID=2803841 RepID=A0ABR9CS36_9HYPH|nr:bifunctional 3-(3-hydroxy-phenyl)propionate/3-hydroxycinnamic acid hydroxylase [Roseibium litorale]MBD8893647.1 bifunctional 3-(3-hydroxy-phenyl)propionate/3-hydroxycinnamic acid hydroxylase [Roseibium litorale]
MHKFDVAVVGYGPTGLTMAALLGAAGHKVLVVERWPTLYGMPRLSHIDSETARLLSLSCDVNEALKASSAIDISRFYSSSGKVIIDLQGLPSTPMGHPDHISIYQPDIEDALDARAKSFANVTVLQGYEVTAVAEGPAGVTLTYKTPDGETKSAQSAFLYAADGARSLARDCAGIGREDHGYNERWLNVDGVFHGELKGRLQHVSFVCSTERAHMSMPVGKKYHRFEFAILDNETDEEAATPEFAGKLLRKYWGLDIKDMEITRLLVYRFECKSAQTWRKGRILLGGDAAHTMPPTLGQGACSAIRDAANLAWKLDFVLRGLADESLLDTYESERRPHVWAIQKAAMAFGSIATTRNKVKAALRNFVLGLNILPPPPPFPPIGEGIKQGANGKKYAKQIGLIPPHGKVTVDGKTDWFDHFSGYRFAVVARGDALNGLTPRDLDYLAKIGAKLFVLGTGAAPVGAQTMQDSDNRFGPYLANNKVEAMILRPDTNLFGLAENGAALSALVGELRSKLSAPASSRRVA